jgi:pyruvate-formate lyase
LACAGQHHPQGSAAGGPQKTDKYRNLIMHIARYSDYFVDLSPMYQEEMITRTEKQI